MNRRFMAALLATALGACAGEGPPPLPGAASPTPTPAVPPPPPIRTACTDPGGPRPVPPGASLAVLAGPDRELTLFLIHDLSGCWIPLDPSQGPLSLTALALHPSGRFLFASGMVTPDRPGVAAYAIVPERGALDGLGASSMEEHAFDAPGSLAATERAVYMLSRGRHTGYHGGMWRWAFDPEDGGLGWRGRAYAAAFDAFFLVNGLDDDVLYLGNETREQPGFFRAAVAMVADGGGGLRVTGSAPLDAPGFAVADPTGTFLWIAEGWTLERARLDAYRPAANGAPGPPERAEWNRRVPVPHPGGRVLYTASATHVEAYAVDPARGTPRLVAQVAYAGADRLPLAVDPAGRFVYAVSPEEVHAFRTAADGRLQDYGRVAPGGTHVLTLRAR